MQVTANVRTSSTQAATSEQPLRLLQVVPAYYPAVRYGGPIRSVHALSSALVRRGHRVSVYTTNIDGETNAAVPIGVPVDLDGVEVTYFPVPTLRRLFWSPALGEHLKRTIVGFDLVHLHSIYLWPTYAAARCAERANVPYFLSPRGMLVRDIIKRRNRLVKSAWIRLIERRSLTRAAAVHFTAELEAQEAQAFGMRLPESLCIPNGVEWPSAHAPLAQGPFANVPRPYALFLSRISWKKGLDRLIKAWKWVDELQLVIAGNDDENYRPTLQALAEQSGVASRVHFVGAAEDAHKWALYENAELFVLPSYSENFGNVVAEAMAMSCPVVVTPEVGLAQLVRDSGAGVVTSGEPAAFAKAINDLNADTVGRRRMGKLGHLAAKERLSWDAIAAQMAQAYARAALAR